MSPLTGKIALVAGASRGLGRGVAVALGQAGATVYVTGRSTRGGRTDNRPETIEETADLVTQGGGLGIAVPCDHTRYDQVEALFQRVATEHGRLDILVNSVFGGSEESLPHPAGRRFWERPREDWRAMMDAGVRSALDTSGCAVPHMLRTGSGLMIQITSWDGGKHHRNVYYDLAMNALCRMASLMAGELREQKIAVLALSPGFVRTERVCDGMPTAMLADTESPAYTGRAVVALATDPDVLTRSGATVAVGDLAREYGFTDVDGRQPPPYKL
ncbi:MAG: SDR family NAD(P)-dependent oxidoreductase [Mycobacterium leprae]